MKKVLAVAAALALCSTALAATYTNEVLVLTSATRVDTGAGWRRGIEIQNLGPNPIYCSLEDSAAAVVSKARRIDFGLSWAVDLPSNLKVYCITSVNQVTTGATIVTEVP